MLYELIGVVRHGRTHEVKEIAKTAGHMIVASGGVVRGITNWGVFLLPFPRRLHGTRHDHGHYFIMRFDSTTRTQVAIRRTLNLDPRMLHYSVIKMGEKLEEIADVPAHAEWKTPTGVFLQDGVTQEKPVPAQGLKDFVPELYGSS